MANFLETLNNNLVFWIDGSCNSNYKLYNYSPMLNSFQVDVALQNVQRETSFAPPFSKILQHSPRVEPVVIMSSTIKILLSFVNLLSLDLVKRYYGFKRLNYEEPVNTNCT